MLIVLGVLLLVAAVERGRDADVRAPTTGTPSGPDVTT